MKPSKAHLLMALSVAFETLTSLLHFLSFGLSKQSFRTFIRRLSSGVRAFVHLTPEMITGRIMRNPKSPELRYRWVHVRIWEDPEVRKRMDKGRVQ
ncbi:MAG: hypothetical protein RL732_943 [Bacteroidota bacterium]|jgi:hypothetical protein